MRLRQAHARLAEGDFAGAASLFGELADSAAVYGLPRAPQLALQSGRAWMLAGDLPRSLQRLRQGLTLLAQTGQLARFPVVAGRVLAELRAAGHVAEADALERELRSLAPGLTISAAAPPSPPARLHLPAKCPYCGGSVHPDAVEWMDEASAACEYCGSTLQAQA